MSRYPGFTIDGQPLPDDWDAGWPVSEESVAREYIPRPLTRCRLCGGEMQELRYRGDKRYRLRFKCLEQSCYAIWYLDYGSVIEMKPVPQEVTDDYKETVE